MEGKNVLPHVKQAVAAYGCECKCATTCIATHGMAMAHEKLSVHCPSVCPSNAWIVTK